MIKFEPSSCICLLPGYVLTKLSVQPTCVQNSVLSLALDHRGNSILDSLMLAVWLHKNYMESYKRVDKAFQFYH